MMNIKTLLIILSIVLAGVSCEAQDIDAESLLPTNAQIGMSYLGVNDTGVSYFPSYLGLKMHIRCYSNVTYANQRGPIALFDAGLPFFSTAFVSIIPDVIKNLPKWNLSKACFLDRYGYHLSDPAPYPITTQDYVHRLRGSLQVAGLTGKYVLVGWSWGSIFVQTYSLSYPRDVVGILTVDGTDSKWGFISSNQESIIAYTNAYTNFMNMNDMGTLNAFAADGNVPLGYGFFPNGSLGYGNFPNNCIESSQQIWLNNKYLKTAIQEFNIMVISSAVLNFTYTLKGHNPLKDLPYVNIYETVFDQDWIDRQLFMASLSTNSIAMPFATDHFFPWSNPTAIVSGLNALANKIATNPARRWGRGF